MPKIGKNLIVGESRSRKTRFSKAPECFREIFNFACGVLTDCLACYPKDPKHKPKMTREAHPENSLLHFAAKRRRREGLEALHTGFEGGCVSSRLVAAAVLEECHGSHSTGTDYFKI
eukprot:TRINITY_DN34682_c0_g2_i1.p2 TRINITY_DN34682_c0_g2~~TRINITY_DN34682_c0_g2_i1.p2  ORF type:complete len:117 (+),score=1.04 TRINITY_DN34682_c0_g2_i1:111-461(+)